MKEILTLTRKDLQLLILDKTSLTLTFALPLALIALVGAVFASTIHMGPGITSYDYAFSKVMFWGLIGGVASSVASVAIEKNSGTLIRLQLSPVTKFKMLAGKSLACITILLFSEMLSWLFATTLFNVKTGSLSILFIAFISNAILFTGVMTFLSHFAKTERAAGALSWSVLQILACFSGIMFPVAMMPSWMVTVTNLNPITWAVKALEFALWNNTTSNELIFSVAIPSFAGIAFFGLSVYIFRWSSEK